MKKLLFSLGHRSPSFGDCAPRCSNDRLFRRECDQVVSNTQAFDGNLIDEDTWESNPMTGDWLEFGGQQFWNINLAKLGDREPDWVVGYISNQQKAIVLDANGNKIPRAFTNAGGNVFEITNVAKGTITVHNGTCAQYYLRVVVHATPRKPMPDAGTDSASKAD